MNNRLTTAAKRRAENKKIDQIASKLLTAQKSGRKSRTPPETLLNYNDRGIPEARKTKFCSKLQTKTSSWTHKYFKTGTCAETLHDATSKNTSFIRATSCQTGLALNKPLPTQFKGLCKQNRALAPWRVICNFWAYFVVATLFLWNVYF